jgi:UDP-glucose 4-epimerase
MKDRSILVAGASGFIGRHAVAFLRQYFNVDTISLRNYHGEDIDMKDVSIILYLSGITHQSGKVDDSIYISVNKELTINFARRAKAQGVHQFIFVSSVKVYGNTKNGIINEFSVCAPEDAYGISKWQAEIELLKMNTTDFIVTIVRPAVVYGSGVKGNIRKLVGLARKWPILPFKGVEAKRSIVYIGNVLAMLKSIIEQRAGGIYIAADSPKSTAEIMQEINLNLKVPKRMIPCPGFFRHTIRLWMPQVYQRLFEEFIVDPKASNERLHFIPPFSFAEGIKEMIRSENTTGL